MENKDLENFEKKEVEYSKFAEKKGNRLCDDAQRKKKRRKEKKQAESKNKVSRKKILVTILIILATLILILGGIVGAYIYKADGDITTAALNMAADVLGEDDPIFVLILGLSEDISATLTDTIILAGYNPDSQKTFMLSIPRDTFIGKSEEYAGGFDKINALYRKGPENIVEAVEKLTGVDIEHYVLVKNTALPAIVNAIGEVEFNVPIDMDYDDPTQNLHIHLKSGTQKINGEKAEQLLRFRHNNDGSSYPTEYGDNDYGRMRTQREFIKAVVSQLINGNTLPNLKDIATAVFNNITTDMSLAKILGYAPSAIKIDVNSVRMEQLPGASDKINELWFYRVDNIKTYDLIHELLEELELDEKEMKLLYTPTSRKNPVVKKPNKDEEKQNIVNEITSTAEGTTDLCEHTETTSKNVLEPTCEETGEEVITCTCGRTQTRVIPATGHSIKEKKTETATEITIVKTCTNEDCDYTETETEQKKQEDEEKEENIEDSHTHAAQTSKIVEEPTCAKEGKRECVCECGETYIETIKKKDHSLKKEKVSETEQEIQYVEYCTKCDVYQKKYWTEKKQQVTPPESDQPIISP